MNNHERNTANRLMVPKSIVDADAASRIPVTQPEWALGKAGVDKLASVVGCDPSNILHVKRVPTLPTPNIGSMLD